MTGPVARRRSWGTALAVVCVAAAGGGALVLVRSAADRDDDARPAPTTATSTTSTTAPTLTTAAPPTTTTTTALTTTTTTTALTTTTTAPVAPNADGVLELGEEGLEVGALQARLDELGYWHGSSDGRYGQLTRQAVMAFQKAEGLGRDGVAGPATQVRLATAARQAPAEPAGDHLEIDLARQILIVVSGGQTRWVLNTSTGNGEAYAAPGGGTAVAVTPTGRFQVQREIDGVRQAPLGILYRPKYFYGGIAIHGSGEIPATPASHGCVRLTNSAMDLLWSSGVAPVGAPVIVH